jgi:hypothetical protein
MSTSKSHALFSGQTDGGGRMLADTGAMLDLLEMIMRGEFSIPVPECGAMLRYARGKHWICDDPNNPRLVTLTAIGRVWMLEQRR